jgi:glutathione S-transferase
MYQLYGFFTQNSLKPLYVIEELGVPYEFHFVNLLKGENQTEHFLGMTPMGKVPVLHHNDSHLFESGAICRYLANSEHSSLYPEDKMQRANVDQWLDYFTCHLGRWLNTLYFENLVKEKVGMGEADPAACEEANKFAHQQLGILNNWLELQTWLANDALSIADLCALAYVEQTRAIDFSLDDYPRVKAWLERMEALESVNRAKQKVQPYVMEIMA